MVLAFFITLSLIFLYVVIFIKKKLSFVANTILFMLLSIILTNYLTIMSQNLKWIHASDNYIEFLSVIVNREFLSPLLGIVMVNGIFQLNTPFKRVLLFTMFAVLLTVLDVLHLYFHAIEYVHWSLLNAVIINILYLMITLVLGKVLFILQRMEGNKNGHYL